LPFLLLTDVERTDLPQLLYLLQSRFLFIFESTFLIANSLGNYCRVGFMP
jgi:hypothetical protein